MKSFNQYLLENRIGDWPVAGAEIEGLRILSDIPNLDSISSSLDEWEELKGIRAVPFSSFGGPETVFYASDDFKRSAALAEQIRVNRTIKPLIIVVDGDGPYILEGAHRFVALRSLGLATFPALVVIDKS